jgi:hypothetical protein
MIAGDKNDAFTDAVVSFLDERIRPTLAAQEGDGIDSFER